MELLRLISTGEQQTFSIGERIGKQLGQGDIVTLHGPLGAGKTVLAKGIASALDITEHIVSPSYTIIQEYAGKFPLYHIDLYRIGDREEFDMLGAEELLYGEGVSVIEWSEIIDQLLPETIIAINIAIEPSEDRTITISGMEAL
ncbi:MAG: tRNA (adenosine(37)-N6)-threonylcarbamoyltransferase complex ATPase subunit type 1 TsaE [Spirochaetota bacterium]